MGQSIIGQRVRGAAIPSPAPCSNGDAPPGSDSHSIDAHLVTSEAAGQRLLESVHHGIRDYIMASTDGQVSVRVRLALNPERRGQQTFAGGALIVDWSNATIDHNANRTCLTQTELRLLSGLLESDGELVSRMALIACAWPRSDVHSRENELGVYICGLRKRLASIGLPDALQTVRRAGYRLRL